MERSSIGRCRSSSSVDDVPLTPVLPKRSHWTLMCVGEECVSQVYGPKRPNLSELLNKENNRLHMTASMLTTYSPSEMLVRDDVTGTEQVIPNRNPLCKSGQLLSEIWHRHYIFTTN